MSRSSRPLSQNSPQCWIERGGPIQWPPRSPNITPCDFLLWGFIKSFVHRTWVGMADEVRERITFSFHHKCWRRVDIVDEFIDRITAAFLQVSPQMLEREHKVLCCLCHWWRSCRYPLGSQKKSHLLVLYENKTNQTQFLEASVLLIIKVDPFVDIQNFLTTIFKFVLTYQKPNHFLLNLSMHTRWSVYSHLHIYKLKILSTNKNKIVKY